MTLGLTEVTAYFGVSMQIYLNVIIDSMNIKINGICTLQGIAS